MARDVTILMRENPFRGPVLKIETFLGPEMATSEASANWAQNVDTIFTIRLPMNEDIGGIFFFYDI
jgi:hypothetical protein